MTERASGGLVSALEPVLGAQTRGTWLGWDGGLDVPRSPAGGLPVDLEGVHLSRGEVERYYHGLSNRTLWPLLHGLVEQLTLDHRWSACLPRRQPAVRRPRDDSDDDTLLWVHDYHLMLVPRMLRGHDPDAASPSSCTCRFRRPRCGPACRGASSARRHARRATSARSRRRASATTSRRSALSPAGHRWRDDRLMLPDGRVVDVRRAPDLGRRRRPRRPGRQPGVDRALRRLRSSSPAAGCCSASTASTTPRASPSACARSSCCWSSAATCAASRAGADRRAQPRRHPRVPRAARGGGAAVGRINGRFTVPGGAAPVHYVHRGAGADQLLAFYRLADVCLVTPLTTA